MNRDTGIRNLIPGVRFDNEIEEDLRSQRVIKKRLEQMSPHETIQTDLRFTPSIDLKPTKIQHKEGEFGYPGYWKSQKQMTDYLTESAKIKKLKTKQLSKQPPQYGVKKFSLDQRDTFPYNQKEALATADTMDKAVANTKKRINQIHKNPAGKIIEKEHAIKDLQRVTDIAYKYSNDQWEHRPEWKLDRKTGSPVDVADPKNDRVVKQLNALKSWAQGSKEKAPYVKLKAAGNKLQAAPKGREFYYNAAENVMELVKEPSPHRADPAAGAKYIEWYNR
mgnify:FL=1